MRDVQEMRLLMAFMFLLSDLIKKVLVSYPVSSPEVITAGTPLFPVTHNTLTRPAGPPVNLYLPPLYRDYMNLSCQNPAFVIVILWGIAIFTTTFLFMGSANLTSGIAIQGVCMIGSAAYLRKRDDTCRTQKQEI